MSKPYTKPITLNKGRVWFTVEEELWLNRWRPEVQQLSNLEGAKVKQAQTEFYTNLVADFLNVFPHRDPNHNPDWIFTSEQLQLAMSQKDRQALRNVRLRVGADFHLTTSLPRLQRMRSKLCGPDKGPPDPAAQAPNANTPGTAVPSPPGSPAPTKEDQQECRAVPQEEASTSAPTEMRDCFEASDPRINCAGPLDLETQLRMAGPRYRTSAEDIAESRDLIKWLNEVVNTSWAEVEEAELR
ncbi:hypothetical protein FRC10_001788, partial [Ceratobasidium sp. 414]